MLHILDAETQQHSLFGPLVYMPITVVLLLSYAQLYRIKGRKRGFDRVAALTSCGGCDAVAVFPRGLDGCFKLCIGHVGTPFKKIC